MARVILSFLASLSVSLLVFFKHGENRDLTLLGRIATSPLCFIPIAAVILCTIAVNYRTTKRCNEKVSASLKLPSADWPQVASSVPVVRML